jgi:hypothetical protein
MQREPYVCFVISAEAHGCVNLSFLSACLSPRHTGDSPESPRNDEALLRRATGGGEDYEDEPSGRQNGEENKAPKLPFLSLSHVAFGQVPFHIRESSPLGKDGTEPFVGRKEVHGVSSPNLCLHTLYWKMQGRLDRLLTTVLLSGCADEDGFPFPSHIKRW